MASTASALVALVAVTALMSAGQFAETPVPIEAKAAALTEGQRVRAVAAAVAAAARDFIGADRVESAMAAHPFADDLAVAVGASVASWRATAAVMPPAPLAERMLDLPPPC